MATKTFKPGSVLSETQFYKVETVTPTNVVLVTDSNEKIQVSRGYAESLLDSADDFTSEEKVTRTELVEKFLASTRVAMTVNFNKKVDEAAIRKSIIALYPNKGGKLISEADFTKQVKSIVKLEGEERTMRGRHYGTQDPNGRVSFVDMDLPMGDPTARKRLVDPRTLNWMITGGVKYVVK